MITKRKDVALINEIRQFVEDNYNKDISVELLCKKFGLNRTKLQGGFNQLFGLPLHAFLSGIRMDKARSMLTLTEDSIKVIAVECGYKSTSSFTRAFTRAHRISPGQYRQQTLS
jgi:AraC-like DNA-binding protein